MKGSKGGPGFGRPPRRGEKRPGREGFAGRERRGTGFDGPRSRRGDEQRPPRQGGFRRAGRVEARTEARPTKTLERVLSKAGLGSRTQARSWIHERRVQVNGKVVENPDQWIDFDRDKITVDGRPLETSKRIYLLLYKPRGVVTTAKDPDGRPTVYDLVRKEKAWFSPVGRLDLDTTGLLILTNDTQFAERLTNPEHKIPKTYQCKVKGILTDEQIEQLRNGVELSDGPTRPAIVNRIRNSEKYSFLEMTITEGRNRQVRRMIEALGGRVMKLTRTAIGPIRIGDLQVGRYRPLTVDELASLAGL